MQRRTVGFVFVLLFIAIETMFYVGDEQYSGIIREDDNAALNTRVTVSNNNVSFDRFGFFLMGDTPYAEWEERMLHFQIAALNQNTKDNILFTVHVGDIQKVQRTNCAESHYQHIADILKTGHRPTFVIPGDNDWFDCPDRDASFSFFTKLLTRLDQNWNHRLPVIRHDRHPELFAMEHNGILFLSIHLINGEVKDESNELWSARMKRNEDWVARILDTYFAEMPIRCVMVLGHSLRSPRTRPFFENLATHFLNDPARLKIPVVYLHGDGHKWDVDSKFSQQLKWKYFYDVQIDQGGFADPCIVEFSKQIDGKTVPLRLQNDNQLLLGRGMVRIDRQRGRYTDEYLKDWAVTDESKV